MKKTFAVLLLVFIALSSALAVGTGFYVPDRPEYVTTDGSAYSDSEINAASKAYPVDTLLEVSNGEKTETVYINDIVEMPADREILLNRKGADAFGISDSGYEDLQVRVILSGQETEEEDPGWIKVKAGTFTSNSEALDLYNAIASSGLTPGAALEDGKISVYARYVPRYMENDVLTMLHDLGCTGVETMAEENPYL